MFNIFKNNCCHAPKECNLVQELRQVQEELKNLENSLNLQTPRYFDRYLDQVFSECWTLKDVGDWLNAIYYGREDPVNTLPCTQPNTWSTKDYFEKNSGGKAMLQEIGQWFIDLADLKEKHMQIKKQIEDLKAKEHKLKKQLEIN